jgi:hypothetical protein
MLMNTRLGVKTMAGFLSMALLLAAASAVAQEESHPFAGLWIGAALIDTVSEPAKADAPTTPTPTASEFPLRLLIHVDAAGQARLLKQVVLLWQPPVTEPDPKDERQRIVKEPGRYVLVTDEALVPRFTRAASDDAQRRSRRFSAIAFDFPEPHLEMQGTFGPGKTLTRTIVLSPDAPTNPFRHPYHPDHDNLDEHYQPLPAGQEEVYEVKRDITLTFATSQAEAASDGAVPTVRGTYREVLTGLHHQALVVSGPFQLQRALSVPVLNR